MHLSTPKAPGLLARPPLMQMVVYILHMKMTLECIGLFETMFLFLW